MSSHTTSLPRRVRLDSTDSVRIVGVALVVAVVALFGVRIGAAFAAPVGARAGSTVFAQADASNPESATIVLTDGAKVEGVVIHERPSLVRIKTAQGVVEFSRDKIREIRRVEDATRAQFDDEYEAAFQDEDIAELWRLANWARGKGLSVASETALFGILEIKPSHQLARSQLGHAKLEGEWIEADEVARLVAAGYRRRGLELVPGPNGPATPRDPEPAPERPDPGSPKPTTPKPGNPEPATPKPVPGDSTGDAKAKEVGPSVEEYIDVQKWLQDRVSARTVLGDFAAGGKGREDASVARFWQSFPSKLDQYERDRIEEHTGTPWTRAQKLNSPNYIVVCNAGGRVGRTYLWILDDLHRELSRFMTGPVNISGRPTIRIFKSQQEFMDQTGMGANTGGFFMPTGIGGISAFYGTFGPTATTFPVLVHEAVHHFQHQRTNLRNLPNWMVEGLAVYYGDGSVLDPKKKKVVTGLVPRDRILHLLDKHERGRHETLRDLAAIQRLNGSQYADAWSLVYFLFNGPDKKKGRLVFIELWQRSLEREVTRGDFEQVVSAAFGSLDELEEKWFEFTKSLKPEPAGKIKGDEFESYEFRVSFERPDAKWEWKNDTDALVELEVPKTDVRCRFALRNRPIRTSQTDKEALEAGFERAKFSITPVFEPKFDKADFYGHEVTVVSYQVPIEKIAEEFTKAYEEKNPIPDGWREQREWRDARAPYIANLPRESRIEFVFRVHNRSYHLTGIAPTDEFDAVVPWFEAIAKTVKPVLEPRW